MKEVSQLAKFANGLYGAKDCTIYIYACYQYKFEPFLSMFKRGLPGAHSSSLARSIIGAEDEDFENDLDLVSHLFLLQILTFLC